MRPSRYLRQLCPTIQEGIDSGCMLIFLLTLGLTLYRHFWLERFDPFKCDALLSSGRWLDNTYESWQPSGCMMHKFEEEDLVTCLKDRKVIFVGDSTIRQIFWATVKKLGCERHGEEDRRADHSLSCHDVFIGFSWDPYLNSSSLHRGLRAASLPSDDLNVANTTAILLIGGGLWHARYLEEDYLPPFQDSFSQIAQVMASQDETPVEQKSIGIISDRLNTDSLITIAPLPVPAYKALSRQRAKTITYDKIDSMNRYLLQISIELQMPLAWSFTCMTTEHERAYQSDGLHVIEVVASAMADVILNTRCNAVLRKSQSKAYPMDKTCCNPYEPPGWIQSLILNLSTALLPLLALITSNSTQNLSFLPSRKIIHAIAVLALAISYCYYADRTHLFNKSQKRNKSADFISLCAITLMLGVLSIRRSKAAVGNKAESQSLQTSGQPFLSRDQTDEWKGWMQVAILVYHYTGASKILWIYQIIRLLVASYLFMSGFGHTSFFCKRADYSLRRCASVLIRLNMLSCILPYVMKTEYIFYYFAPLISFWYLVIYCTMAFGRCRNHSSVFLIVKTLISAALVNFTIRLPGLLEMLFYFLEKSCNIHWDVVEWRFRLQLDSYIVYVGMLCAMLYVRIADALRSNAAPKSDFNKLVQWYFYQICVILGILAILAFPVFSIFAYKTSTKQEYNGWVPYVSAIPILAFIILRNFSRHARNFHSSIFAWIGRHSLETFTLQFHIWLAADTKGLLAIGILERASGDAINGRNFDMVVLTIIFLWVCWHVAAATQTLTSWLVNPREGREDEGVGGEIGGEDLGLPLMKSEKVRTNSTRVGRLLDDFAVSALRSASRIKRLVTGHLGVRLAIIMVIMWLLNIMDA